MSEIEAPKKIPGFKVKNILNLKEVNMETFIPESDLTIQHGDNLIQYSYIRSDEQKKESVKPGIYTLESTNAGVVPMKMELREANLLTGVVNTSKILAEASAFFSNLEMYKKLEQPQKRGVLLYSVPGLGKTASIGYFCRNMVTSDSGTVVLNWPTDKVKASEVSSFLSTYTEFTKECTKLILIIEDIGGGNKDYNGDRSVSASLLNMLDGQDFVFRLPTFIIATTNHPENLLGALCDRPGRFDLVMELLPPNAEERVELVKFIAKRDLTKDEIDAVSADKVNGFSIAHLKEIIIRSSLHGRSIATVIDELIAHTDKYKSGFIAPKKNVGFGAGMAQLLADMDDD